MKHFENNDTLHGFMRACGCSAQQWWPSAVPRANRSDPAAPLWFRDSISFWYASRRADLVQGLSLKPFLCHWGGWPSSLSVLTVRCVFSYCFDLSMWARGTAGPRRSCQKRAVLHHVLHRSQSADTHPEKLNWIKSARNFSSGIDTITQSTAKVLL